MTIYTPKVPVNFQMWKTTEPEKPGTYLIIAKIPFSDHKKYKGSAEWDGKNWKINNAFVCLECWLDTSTIPMESII